MEALVIQNLIDEALAMLKAKEDKKEEVLVVIAAKKEQAKDKSARDSTALVTTGSEILQRLD